ncbi:ROK family protein [Salsipaludibacter albus]|uniref:ROK family protein n=1 Tax=Salsipaludibacter albus TaxID=2849650 RepID=UPI001EE3FF2B|nr:ROK family protein [Salsipaludibacter albus]MBY5162013.1 ROK family protein [Salsipaludibacter albus]
MEQMSPRRGTARLAGPADQHSVRNHNLALVLQHVAATTESSRARLAADTGLNKTTVSSLVTELLERRLLTEGGVRRSGEVGRPAVTVQLDGDVYVAIGMEINVDSMAFSVVDLRSRVRDEGWVVFDNRTRSAEEALEALAELVSTAVRRVAVEGLVPVGASIGLPGLVDAKRRSMLIAPNLGWHDVPVSDILRELLPDGLDVTVDNEANLAALAERWHGAGRELTDFIHISGEVGVGAGVIINGTLHRGAVGFGGELGHMTLEPDGPACACGGRGCVETYIGLEPTLRLAGFDVTEAMGADDDAPAAADRLAEAARAGDEQVLTALTSVGAMLGTAMSSAVNLLSPQGIVLGGYFTALHEWLEPAIAEQLHARVLAERQQPTQILPSRLQREATARGAAEQVLREVLANPTRVPPTG